MKKLREIEFCDGVQVSETDDPTLNILLVGVLK